MLRYRRWAILWPYLPGVTALVSIAVAAVSARNRTPWSDEGQFSSASYNLAKHGFFGTTVMELAGTGLTRMDQHTYWIMPLFPLGEALWYRVFPADVFWTRAFSIAWIPIALTAFFLFLDKLTGDRRVSSVGVSLLALSFVFIDNAAFARPDLMCCALGLCGLAAYVRLRDRSLPKALFWSNVFIAASGLSHPNGILHFAALALLVIWLDRFRLTFASLAAAAVPYLLFALPWSVYIFQDHHAFLDQMRYNGTNGRWTPTLNPFVIIWREIRDRYLVTFGLVTRGPALLKAYALLVYLLAVVCSLADSGLRRRPETRLLLALLAVYLVLMSVFNQKLSYYLINIVPIYIALVAIWLVWNWDQYPRLRPILVMAALLLAAIDTGGLLLKAHMRSYIANERGAIDFLRSHTLPSDRIVGTAGLIYDLGFDPRLRDDPYVGLRSGRPPDAIVVEVIYQDMYTGWATQRPVDQRAINARLAQYQLAYQNPDYKIFLAPGR
ncbi:MAG: hypothetical protein ABSB35_26825 [Bryobacteraceae bacterium]|jgi:hypothetical protein